MGLAGGLNLLVSKVSNWPIWTYPYLMTKDLLVPCSLSVFADRETPLSPNTLSFLRNIITPVKTGAGIHTPSSKIALFLFAKIIFIYLDLSAGFG